MSARLFLAPASTGKTAYVLDRAREAARDLQSIPRVVVPTHLQVRACRRRLAEMGGAIGVQVYTFDKLYAECLSVAGETYTELSDPVQYRLMRAIVDELPLAHYAPLTDRPGFVQVLQKLIGELKAARVWPEAFTAAVSALGDEPRLHELALVYTAYQDRLHAQGWADRAGLGWLAVEALEERAPQVGRDWPLLLVDAFDSFTPVQSALLEVLATRVGELIITLTGTLDGCERALAHRRFARTRRDLEGQLGVTAVPLPDPESHHVPALVHLEAGLFCGDVEQVDAADVVDLIEVPDRATEVRAALRWLKTRLIEDGMRPAEVALLARDVGPYRPFIQQTAAEFGLPVRLVDGLPLTSNPAVAALLDLLRLVLPSASGASSSAGRDPEPALPWRLVLETWRSPYFDWLALPEDGAPEPIGITPEDADALDAAARWGRVISGLSQWEEILADLAARADEPVDDGPRDRASPDEERGIPAGVPVGAQAHVLRDKFQRSLQRITPPQGEHRCQTFVGWLEALIGPDPALQSARYPAPEEPTALQVVGQTREGTEVAAERDVAALQVLKDVLRGLVWAEEALATPSVDFPRFFNELAGAVEATFYRLPVRSDREEITVADVVQARGVPFRAVAVLGLAEGEFPTTIAEDPFLREADRQRLRRDFDLLLESSTESAEAEFFYETVTRPRERLLLTRPRLADNGAPWQASPFWEEVRRLVDVRPETLTSESVPEPARAGSWPELMESLATCPHDEDVRSWVRQAEPTRLAALETSAHLFRLRRDKENGSPYDGDLNGLAEAFSQRFGPTHTWSTSRLEAYRTCPFLFFVSHVLGLEPRDEPTEGLDVRQLGNIYHRILEYLYPTVDDPTDLDQLLATLPQVAGAVLDKAPRREGFRMTAWWRQTRDEIVEYVRRSLEALAEVQGDFIPSLYEAVFGLGDHPALVVRDGQDSFCVRGLIDRVDRTPDGKLRIIDYKTGGPWAFTKRAVAEGKKLQLPLYALAAREALELGEPVDGFYWHVQHAESSSFTLGGFDGGPERAMTLAVAHTWEAVRAVRGGHFVPCPPDGGCPSWCPATGFCWHFRPGFKR